MMNILGLALVVIGVVAMIAIRNTLSRHKNQPRKSSDSARRQRLGLSAESKNIEPGGLFNNPTTHPHKPSPLSADMVARLEPAKQPIHKSPKNLKLQVFFAATSMILFVGFYLLRKLMTFLGVYD